MEQQQAPLHEHVFYAFREAAQNLNVYAPLPQRADAAYLEKFALWQDAMCIKRLELPAEITNGFDRAWIFNLTSRANTNRKKNSPFPLLILAVDSRYGRMAVMTTDTNPRHFEQLMASGIAEIYDALNQFNGKKNTVIAKPKNIWPGHSYTLHATHTWIEKDLFGQAMKTSFLIATLTEQANNSLQTAGNKRDVLRKLAQIKARNVLDANISDTLSEFRTYIDINALQAAETICENYRIPEEHNTIAIYNHIVSAANPLARETRIGALPLILRSGCLYMDDTTLWADIDEGMPLYAAIGKSFGVQAGTIRNMLRSPVLSGLGRQSFQSTAQWLDPLNIQRWPKTAQELADFNIACQIARQYGKAFNRNKYATLAQWAKEAGPRCSWKRLAFRKLKKSMRDISEHEIMRTPELKKLYLGIRARPTKQGVPNLNNAPPPRQRIQKFLNSPSFWDFSAQKYGKALEDITDMKSDIAKRLLRAAMYRALKKQGWKVTSSAHLENLETKLQERLWHDCPPHEQIEASSYWHSPNVNFGMRLQSLTQTEGMVWHTVIAEPLKLSNGITAYPLASNDALREEGAAMEHCVWSYGYNCLKHGHHIFSLRNERGERLSTLDLVEKRTNGSLEFTIQQNNAASNHTPTQAALAAGKELAEKLKTMDIDWAPIERDRAEFAAREIDAAVGYDYHDNEQVSKVLNLYAPCLPRKLLRQSAGTLDGLGAALGVPALVSQHLAENTTRTGLLATQAAPRNAPHPQGPRP